MRQFCKIKKLRASVADNIKTLKFLLLFLFFNYKKGLLKTAPTGLLTTYFNQHNDHHARDFTLPIYG